jgi:hypothetical protein
MRKAIFILTIFLCSNLRAQVNPGQGISLGSVTINGAMPAGGNNVGSVTVANSSLAVTGTFWPAIQPISLAAGASAIAKAEDVASADGDGGVPSMAIQKATPADTAGTDGDYSMLQMSAGRLWTSSKIDTALPAGSNNIGSFTMANASMPVTGTFWQATQPVSLGSISINGAIPAGVNNIGSVTVANASVAVTGTFWQATQPISLGSISINGAIPAGVNNIGSVTVANASLAVTGTFWQATQPISLGSISINGAIPAGGNNIGSVTLAASTASIGTIVNGGGTVQLAAGSNNVGSVTLAASTASIGTVTAAAGSNNIGSVTLAGSSNNVGSVTLAAGSAVVLSTVTDTTTGDTGTKVATFAGATQTNSNGAAGAIITIKLGTVSGTSPTLSARFQYSYDGGTNWLDIGPALANLTATGQIGILGVGPNNWSAAGSAPGTLTNGATVSQFNNMRMPRLWRINYTIAGTTPSFAVTNVYVNYTN